MVALLGSLALSIALSLASPSEADPKGPYLGETPPGMTPKLFAPGFVSTDRRELNSVFSPDGNELYFAYSDGKGNYEIVVTRRGTDGRWTEPETASFSKEYSNVDLALSHDGRRVYFGSNRPRSGGETPEEGFGLWMALRKGNGWGEPTNLGEAINSGEHQIYPTVTRDGTLYFQARREGGFGGSDIYRSRLVDGVYGTPENLGPAINTEANEGDVFIAPDESYLVVSTYGRDDSLGRGDLYVSFCNDDGSWTPVKNMGKPINSEAIDFCPMLSPDGKHLFFSSARAGTSDIYWVDSRVIEQMR